MLLNLARKKDTPTGYIAVESANVLLSKDRLSALIRDCKKLTALQDQPFKRLYLQAIYNYSLFVQKSPASEYNHHAYPGGLLEHTLESCVYALKSRKGILLPTGVTAETEPNLRDIYTYGVFVATLCHDLAKPAVDQKIYYLEKNGKTEKTWNPFDGNLFDVGAWAYRIEFQPNRLYRTHSKAALIFIHRIIPAEGLDWLKSDTDIFGQVLDILTGVDNSGPVEKIVRQADQHSTSKALGSENTPTYTNQKPLHFKIKTALQSLIRDGKITLNRKGANGWVAHSAVWVLAKTAVDSIRDYLVSEGHEGVPNDNSRMFDVMMDYGLIEKNPHENKAIWKVTIESVDWQPAKPFSVIKVPVSVFTNLSINEYEGIVSPQIIGNMESKSPTESTVQKADHLHCPKPTNSDTSKRNPALIVNDAAEENLASIDDIDPYLTESSESATIDHSDSEDSPETMLTEKFRSEDVGTDFFFWVKDAITAKSLSVNTQHSLVHNMEIGVLLVSPAIFQEYAIKKSLDWKYVQRRFQALRINLKTQQKGENTFNIRVTGKRKITTVNGWIVPHEEFKECTLPGPNTHLEVLRNDA